jgi:cation/acetate symporter
MYWKGLTTRGAILGGWVGLLSAVLLTVLSPSIWKNVLGFPAGIFPYDSPALFTMPLGFLCCWIGSLLDHSARGFDEAGKFEAQYLRAQTGIGAEEARAH